MMMPKMNVVFKETKGERLDYYTNGGTHLKVI